MSDLPRFSFDFPEPEFPRLLLAIFARGLVILFLLLAAGTAMATNDVCEKRAGQIARLTPEDRMTCEDRRAHARLAYKELIFDRCIANFAAKYDRGNQ